MRVSKTPEEGSTPSTPAKKHNILCFEIRFSTRNSAIFYANLSSEFNLSSIILFVIIDFINIIRAKTKTPLGVFFNEFFLFLDFPNLFYALQLLTNLPFYQFRQHNPLVHQFFQQPDGMELLLKLGF